MLHAHLITQSTRAHNFQEQQKTEKRRAENLAEKAGTARNFASAAELKRVRFLMLFRGLPSHPVCQNEVIRQCTSEYNSMIRFMQALKAMEPETFDLVRVRACSYTANPLTHWAVSRRMQGRALQPRAL